MKFKQLLLLVFLDIFHVYAFSQAKLIEKVIKKGSELVIPYEKYKLPNGLTVIIHEDHSDPIASVEVYYNVGSAKEELGKTGFAHLFEHISGKSEHIPKVGIIAEAGGTGNAGTARYGTEYYSTVPANHLEKVLWMEADRMGFLLGGITQEKLENERNVIKTELSLRALNIPYGLAYHTILKNLYPYGHPLSWDAAGAVSADGKFDDLDKTNLSDVKNFFLRWYSPNNAILVVAGDVVTAEVVEMINKYFDCIPRGPEVSPLVFPQFTLAQDRYVKLTDNFAYQPRLYIAYPSVAYYHKDAVALECLVELFAQGKNSFLYQLLVKTGVAQEVSYLNNPYHDPLGSELYFTLTPSPKTNLIELEKYFRQALISFEKKGVSDKDITMFKGRKEYAVINSIQSVVSKAFELAFSTAFSGKTNSISEKVRRYTSLTKEDVLRVYDKYIKGKGAVLLSVIPKGQETNIAAKENYIIQTSNYSPLPNQYFGLQYKRPKENFDWSEIPKSGHNVAVKALTAWRKNLPNGINIIGNENPEVPIIILEISIPGGHLLQSKDLSKAGLSSMFAAMMNERSKNYSSEQINIELQKLGSSINVRSELDKIVFDIQTLKKNLDKTLTLLKEKMFYPDFTKGAFSRIQKQRLQLIRKSASEAGSIANNVFDRVIFGNQNILSISQEGTEETLNNITFDDIKNYYSNNMTSMGTNVVVVGDIKQNELITKLVFLDMLPRKKIDLSFPSFATPLVNKSRVYFVDIPDATLTELRIGYIPDFKYDPVGDYYKMYLSNYIFGQNGDSRLNSNLRGVKGWTYFIRSNISANKYYVGFQIFSPVGTNVTDSALIEIKKELANYLTIGPTELETTQLKNTIVQREARLYESFSRKANFLSWVLENNLPIDYITKQQEILKSTTKEQLKEYAGKYLNFEKMNILLVGDKKKILESVKKMGYEIVELDRIGNVINTEVK